MVVFYSSISGNSMQLTPVIQSTHKKRYYVCTFFIVFSFLVVSYGCKSCNCGLLFSHFHYLMRFDAIENLIRTLYTFYSFIFYPHVIQRTEHTSCNIQQFLFVLRCRRAKKKWHSRRGELERMRARKSYLQIEYSRCYSTSMLYSPIQ